MRSMPEDGQLSRSSDDHADESLGYFCLTVAMVTEEEQVGYKTIDASL